MTFTTLKSAAELKAFNEHLVQFSYVGGDLPTSADADAFIRVKPSSLGKEHSAASRWYKHMCSFNETEKKSFVRVSITPVAKAAPAAAPAAPAAPAKAQEEEDDDDFDLFGEETEEEKAAAKASAAAKAAEIAATKAAKPAKKAPILKSTLVIDCMPGDSEIDFEAFYKTITEIEMEGVAWAPTWKKIPMAYGLCKLQIGCTIVDDIVETDKIVEKILTLKLDAEQAEARLKARDEGEDEDDEIEFYVLNADIVGFNKL